VRAARSGVGAPALLLVLAAAAVYANALTGPFLFDDFAAIVDNPAFRSAGSFLSLLSAPDESTLAGRPVVTLTFALNRAVGGTDVRGYHAVNILIHALCSLVLYGIVRRTLCGPRLAATFAGAASNIALAAALIWTVHPLCTEAVDYVVQRTETLMALFYLLTLYCAIRTHDGPRRCAWGMAAVAACALGMGCKEVMVTCPLVVLLHEWAYFSPPDERRLRERMPLYAGLAACWAVLALLLWYGPRGESVGFSLGVSAWSYLENQWVVVIDYMVHVFWPHPLVFDYGYPRELALASVAPRAILLLMLVGLSATAMLIRPAAGFPAMAFFTILAPTSSVVPIVTEVGAERRLYLPLAGLIVLVVVAAHVAIGRLAGKRQPRRATYLRVASWVVALSVLGTLTVRRNADYRSAEAIWRSAVRATPENARAHNGLGRVLYMDGRIDEAVASYRRALEIERDYYHAQFNLGLAFADRRQYDEALGCFERAARLHPGRAEPRYRTASVLSAQGRDELAIAELQRAVEIDPDFPEARNDLGNALLGRGLAEEGIRQLRRAVELRPDFALAHYNLALALDAAGDLDEAMTHNRVAVELVPRHAMAHNNLGTLLQRLGRLDEAVRSYREALRIDPGTVEAGNNLGLALWEMGRLDEAIAEFRAALRSDPDFALARQNLDRLEAALAARDGTSQ
jgi:tetratricopeptide (TPR) repeat protein